MLTKRLTTQPVPFGDPEELDRGAVPRAVTNLLVHAHRAMRGEPSGTYGLELSMVVDQDEGTVTYVCDISEVPGRRAE
ncbi:MAG TPA: hypothetical protein VHQ86_05390 [Candidatus Saccharimonadia bacterium]|nr:hypothetical protein [Candidatus Saccharimonadia bacterium]